MRGYTVKFVEDGTWGIFSSDGLPFVWFAEEALAKRFCSLISDGIGFEDLEPGLIKPEIRITTSGNFRARLWLIKQATRAYFLVVRTLSKGVIIGEMEI